MGKSINYLDLAENDYQFLVVDYESGRVGNILCSSAQFIKANVTDFECDWSKVMQADGYY